PHAARDRTTCRPPGAPRGGRCGSARPIGAAHGLDPGSDRPCEAALACGSDCRAPVSRLSRLANALRARRESQHHPDADERRGQSSRRPDPSRSATRGTDARGARDGGGLRRPSEEGVQGMSLRPEEIDLYRRRWREGRRRFRLVDPLSEDFGTGGLARHAPEVHVRFLVLPCDPAAAAVQFDQDFWAWWMQDRPNPFEGASPTSWGREGLPEATAAVRCERWADDRWNWSGYLALHRSGGLEFGLGRLGSARWRRGQEEDETHVFFLTTIVGRVWVALSLFAEVLERVAFEGPS